MFVARRLAPVAIGLVCALFLSACENKEEDTPAPTPVAPAPTPAPTPTPSAPTFSVSGTISETAPTASTRVGDAEVQLTGGVATGSVNDGTFTIPNVASGSYTLRIAKSGYETQTRSITVSGADVSGIQVSLMPVWRQINQEISAELSPDSPPCAGTTRPCNSYTISSHHGGEVRAFLAWNLETTDYDFEYRCGGNLVERRGITGGNHDEILPRINPGQTCQVYVLHSGARQRYTLYLTYPY
jgi:hypothetical protein